MPKPPKPLNLEELMTYAGQSLTIRAQSLSELRTKLKRRAAEPKDVDEVISRLKQAGIMNDQRFADSFAGWRLENQGFGKARVLRDLLARRVAPEVARKATDKVFSGADEVAMVEQFLAREYRGKNLGALLQDDKQLASAFRKLRTAGFGASPSIRVLKRYAASAERLEDTPEEPE